MNALPSKSPPNQPPISEALRRDLSLVLPDITAAHAIEPNAFIAGKAVSFDDAIARACALIEASRAPAIVGLSGLTIEGVRQAVELAEHARAKLLPHPAPNVILARAPVIQTATLGHALACEAAILVGDTSPANAIVERICECVSSVVQVNANMATVRSARLAFSANDESNDVTSIIQDHARVVALLSPDCSAQIAEQWHELAAQSQMQCRLAILALPDLRTAGNLRGALEVITWQTGLSCASGGVDFASGAPRPCNRLGTLLKRSAIDLVIDTGLHPVRIDPAIQRIVFSPRVDPMADVCFAGPPLATGIHARVMRFDGVVLWLCDESPGSVPMPDPTAAILECINSELK